MVGTQKKFDLELFFNALADKTRLRLLNLIGDDEVCVCFFVEVLGTNQPKISRHLAYLRKAGIVEARREATWVHYWIVEPEDADAARLLKEVRFYLLQNEEMQADRARMVNICCAEVLPESVQDAPLPASLRQMRCDTKC